jgi:hypothetical protein
MLDQLGNFVNTHPWQAIIDLLAVLGWGYGYFLDRRLRKLEDREKP